MNDNTDTETPATTEVAPKARKNVVTSKGGARIVAQPKGGKKAKGKTAKGKASAKKGGKPTLTEDARLYRNGYSRGYKGYAAPPKGAEPKAYMEGWQAGNEKGAKRLKAGKPLP